MWVLFSILACKSNLPFLDCPAIADPGDCAAQAGCMVTAGRPVVEDPDAGGPCFDRRGAEELHCVAAQACDSVATYATEGDGAPVFQFDSCIPEGWTTVEGPVDACACASIDLGDCAANPDCKVISGSLLGTDATGWCVDPSAVPQPVVCAPASDCGDVPTYMTQPSTGVGYHFPNNCTPPGWELLYSDRFLECGA